MRTVVGVLRGGPSSEYEVSLKTGANVLAELNRDKYEPRDLFVDRSGAWHLHGRAVAPEKALLGLDVVFNAMHGQFGEDGQVQRLLDAHGVPYTGSDALASAVAFNKQQTRDAVQKLGVKVAHGAVYDLGAHDPERLAHHIFRTMPHPAIIKPVAGGSSVGTSIADSFHALEAALERAAGHTDKILVEEFIKGREATVGVIDDFRGDEQYALLPVEIIPPAHRPFFDYEAKYSGETQEISPGRFSRDQKDNLMDVAKKVHKALGLSHYSRSDFIVSRRGIYFLEVNTLPGLTSESLLPKALHTIGAKVGDFLDHVLTLARFKK